MKRHLGRTGIGLVCAAACFSSSEAPAQDAVAQFYKGKIVNFYIGYPPGGGYDLYARLEARFMGAHIPGNPTIVPRNMPGAGSQTAAVHVLSVAPPDGTSIGTNENGVMLQQIIGDKALKFDVRTIRYIGNPMVSNNTMSVWTASGIKTIDDAKKREVTMGAISPTNAGAQYPRAANLLFGTKFKIVYGYPGTSEISLAMEKGEVDGRGSNDWVTWKATKPDWVAAKKFTVLTQIGLTRDPELANVPLLMELATNEKDREVLRLLSSIVVIGRPMMTAPGVPPERLAALRKAFDDTMTDPKFLAEAARQRLPVTPTQGVVIQKLVADAINNTPKDTADRLREIIEPSSNER